jgi:hypothetical protein
VWSDVDRYDQEPWISLLVGHSVIYLAPGHRLQAKPWSGHLDEVYVLRLVMDRVMSRSCGGDDLSRFERGSSFAILRNMDFVLGAIEISPVLCVLVKGSLTRRYIEPACPWGKIGQLSSNS